MNIAFLYQYAGSGTEKVLQAVERFLKVKGHTVVSLASDMASNSDIVEVLAQADIVHYWNIGAMIQHPTASKPFGVTIHHIPTAAPDHYIQTLKNEIPDWVHVLDLFTQRQLGQHEISSLCTAQPLYLDQAQILQGQRERNGTHIAHIGADGKRQEIVVDIAMRSSIPLALRNSSRGWVPQEHIDEIFAKAAIYICASWEDAGPIPCIEALLRGVPVLTTPVGQMPNLIIPGVNGNFFDGTSDHALELLEQTMNLQFNPVDTWEKVELFTSRACQQFEEKLLCVLT